MSLVATRSPAMEVAELALARFHVAFAGNWPYQMAAAVMVTLPVLAACIAAQRYVMRGAALTGGNARF